MADRTDSDLDIYADHRHPTYTVTSATTAVAGRRYSVDTTAGSVTMTLPTLASTPDGAEFEFYKVVAGNSMVIDGAGAETIEGSANVTRTAAGACVSIRKAGAIWQLYKNAQPDGDLVAANNLSDVADAATARTNLGVPATAAVLAVASNLSDVASAATSRGNLGIAMVLHNPSISLAIADAAVWYYIHPTGAASGVLTSIDTRLSGALTTGNATLTAAIDGTPVTNGVVTITEAGSAAGDEDVATPTAARTIAAGQVLSLTVGGTNDAARTASVSIRLTY
jgi:hypothetical protein